MKSHRYSLFHSAPAFLSLLLYTHTVNTPKTHALLNTHYHQLSLLLSVCLSNTHAHTHTCPHFSPSHFGSRLCCSIDWTRPSIAFKYSYLSEEELWSMNGGTSKDFLLILSFPRYRRRFAIISSLLPLAISLCSEVRGLCRHTNAAPPRHLAKSR